MPAATVRKWGNSAAVRIPAAVLADADFRLDEPVEIHAENGAVVIRRARPRYTLEELCAQITPDNRHGETDWGPDVGLERLPNDEAW